MADFNSDIIKPVESLRNVTGISPARRREDRRRREQLNKNSKENKQENDNSLEENLGESKSQKWPDESKENDNGRIDFCA